MKMKMFFMLMLLFLVGCGQAEVANVPPVSVMTVREASQEPLRVVATTFPQYDFIRQIAGDRVHLTMLLSPGAESHSFEPSPRDMVTLNSTDLLVYIGGHSENWVEPILASLELESIYTVALVDLIDTLWEVVHDHDHHHHDHDDDDDDDDHDHDHHHDDHDDHDHEHHDDEHHDNDGSGHPDEHVWTSPQNAIAIVSALTEVLEKMDPINADFYRENSMEYIRKLSSLDEAFARVVAEGVRDTVVFGDRFPFRYLMEAYGLEHYAAFEGCSSETQASPATVAALINLVQEENIPIVFYVEFSDRAIANVIAESTGAELLELHSAHNVSQEDYGAGVTYLDLMQRNVEHLKQALSSREKI